MVDDEVCTIQELKKGFEINGFQVDTCTDPEDCLSVFKPNPYDLQVLDVLAPSMTGIQLLREMRKIDPKA